MTNISNNNELEQEGEDIFLCSNICREPQVFDQYGPGISGLARDIAIWTAWNANKGAIFVVKDFAAMFGYDKSYLFRKLPKPQLDELKQVGFGREFKDRIGYALAKMTYQRLMFVNGYQAINSEGELAEVRKYTGLNIIGSLTSSTSRAGTVYRFEVSKTYLANCRTRFQRFRLADYLAMQGNQGHAYSAARKMYLHLLWKRRLWDTATKKPGVKPSISKFEELIDVAGFEYKQEARSANELRQLLDKVGLVPSIKMTGNVNYEPGTGNYLVRFKRH